MKLLIAFCMAFCLLWTPNTSEAVPLVIRPTEQLPQVVVKENFIQLVNAKLEQVLAENGETRRHEIQPVIVPAGARLPEGRISYEVFIPNGIRYGKRMQVCININVDGVRYTQIHCTMMIHVYEKMVTASHQLRPEVELTASDLRLEEREIGLNNYTYYTDFSQVIGKVPNKITTEGSVLYKHILWNPQVIQTGDVVTIIANVNGVEIRTEGIAKQPGRAGAYINVLNPTSNRILRAKVIDANTVMIKK